MNTQNRLDAALEACLREDVRSNTRLLAACLVLTALAAIALELVQAPDRLTQMGLQLLPAIMVLYAGVAFLRMREAQRKLAHLERLSHGG